MGKLRPRVLWDVIEEYFDEIDYLVGAWFSARRSWRYTLGELGTKLDARIRLNVGGFTEPGLEAFERFVYPALDEAVHVERPLLVDGFKAAALLVTQSEDAAVLDAAVERMSRLNHVGTAVGLAEVGLASASSAFAERMRDERRRSLAVDLVRLVLGYLPEDWGDAYLTDEVRRDAALAYIARTPDDDSRQFIRRFVQTHADAHDDVLAVGILRRSSASWDLAHRRSGEGELSPLLGGVYGSLAEYRDLRRFIGANRSPQHVAWVLGFSPCEAAEEALYDLLQGDDEDACRLAAEALAFRFGLSLEDRAFFDHQQPKDSKPDEVVLFEDDDLDADLAPSFASTLPRPKIDAFVADIPTDRRAISDARNARFGIPYPESLIPQAPTERIGIHRFRIRQALDRSIAREPIYVDARLGGAA